MQLWIEPIDAMSTIRRTVDLPMIQANRIWFDSREGAGTTFYTSLLPLGLVQAVTQ